MANRTTYQGLSYSVSSYMYSVVLLLLNELLMLLCCLFFRLWAPDSMQALRTVQLQGSRWPMWGPVMPGRQGSFPNSNSCLASRALHQTNTHCIAPRDRPRNQFLPISGVLWGAHTVTTRMKYPSSLPSAFCPHNPNS